MEKRKSISYSADNIVIRGNGEQMELLVVERKYPPFQGDWALPGGFIEEGEEPLHASVRELMEETNLALDQSMAIELSVRQMENRDPRGRVITHPFLFWIGDRQVSIKAGDDAKQAQWIKLTELGSLAFDHGAILCEALGKFWSSMPTYDSRLEGATLPKVFNRKTKNTSIYFGGSFNPWHQGHDECLRQCLGAQQDFDIVVVPDTNPWKSTAVASATRCFYTRLILLAKNMENTSISFYPGFWGAEAPNPTISWLPHTKDAARGLLIGDDNFLSFHQWKDYHQLLRSLTRLYTVPRLHSKSELEKQREKLLAECPNLEIVILENHPYQDQSSTKLRSK